jgi:hypothetical protein
MKKIFALALAAVSTASMFAAINSQVTLYLDTDSKEVEARVACGDTYSPFNAGASAYYAPQYGNPSNIGMYVQYQGGSFMELNAPELINVPLVVVTSREASALQNYELFAEVGANHTTPIYLTDLRPDGGGDPVTIELNNLTDYSFTLKDEPAFVEGTNSVIADRFVINYNYVNLNGDFDNPDGGGAWIWLNDFVEHGQTATKEYTLPADAWCHFKVVENGVDYADGFAFDESNKSHLFTTTGWTQQLTLHTGEAGVYTFTWNYTTNTLEITFPTPAPVYAAEVTTNAYGLATFSYNADLEAVESGVKLYKGAIDGEFLDVDEVNYVKADEGVIVYGEANTTYHFNVGNGETSSFAGNQLLPSSAWNLAEQDGFDIYVLSGNLLYLYEGTEMKPNKAFLKVNQNPMSGNNAPRRISLRFNQEQGVENVAPEAVKAEKFVENGVIYIRRGNEVFNLQGQIVK